MVTFFFTKSPEEKESLSYKKGHFETQRVARYRTINTASLAVARDDFSENSHREGYQCEDVRLYGKLRRNNKWNKPHLVFFHSTHKPNGDYTNETACYGCKCNIIRGIPAVKDNSSLGFHCNVCEFLFIFILSYCTSLKIDAGAVWTVSVFVLTSKTS